jgi:hypothetical protein
MAMGLKQEALPMLDLWENIQRFAVFENTRLKHVHAKTYARAHKATRLPQGSEQGIDYRH